MSRYIDRFYKRSLVGAGMEINPMFKASFETPDINASNFG
jgi:hypothetical protein